MKTQTSNIARFWHSPWSPWLIGFMVMLPAIWPFFHDPLFRVHDYTHVARLAEMYRTISEGAFPPRWSRNLGFGYGMPLFSFYAPLPYYLGVLFHAVGLSLINCVKLLFILTFYGSFMAMFFLAREFWSAKSAYLAAMLFLYVPYRAVDVYVRGALGELYGILFMTVALWAVVKLVRSGSRTWLMVTALALAGLLLSHNLMALIGLPLVGIFGGWYVLANRRFNVMTVGRLGIGFIWGIGLAAFFILPAFLEKSFTSVDQLTQGGGDYAQHFVYLRQLLQSPFNYGGSIAGPNDGISFEIGKIQWLMLGLAALVLVIRRKKLSPLERQMLYFGLVIVAGALYLMTAHSEDVWKAVPLLNYLQFPWRLLTIPMIVIPLTAGAVVDKLTPKKYQTLVIGLLGAGLIVFYLPIYKPDPKVPDDASIYSTAPAYIQTHMSTVIPDYIHPRLSHVVLAASKDLTPPPTRFFVTGGTAQMTVIKDWAQSVKVTVTTDGPFIFGANIFDFPGWEWRVNGTPTKYVLGDTLPIMLINEATAPPGSYIIEGFLGETPLRKTVDWISAGSLILIGLVSVFGRSNRRKAG